MRSTKIAVITLSGTLVLAAAGCTSSKGSGSKSSSAAPSSKAVASTTSGTAATVASPTITQLPLPTGSVPNDTEKRKAVAVGNCAAVDGGWQATGTAKNDGSSSQTYAITIYFTTSGNSVLTQATTSVKVAPGKTENWSASAKFSAPKVVNCVLRGVG